MKKIIGILLIMATVYYGVAYYNMVNNSPPRVDPALREIVTQWENHMLNEGIDYQAGFNRISYIRIVDDYGVDAGHFDKGSKTINISKVQMKKGYYSTRAAVWHELGHFVFNLNHDDDPTDVMFYKSLEEIEYKLIWNDMTEHYSIKCKAHEWEARL